MMRKASVPIFVAALTGAALIGFSAGVRPTPIVIWNASASVPVGFYRVVSGAPKRGDFVLVRTPESPAKLAYERGYLPVGVPLVKHLAAIAGDYVCISNSTVQINGAAVARQLKTDRAGRPLPRWAGCRLLERDELFLLADAPDSFDSRYFGPVKSDRLIGRLVPLWTE
ncbi:MAG: conjugative transfer signal peptidase TraF [Alphaproteobacteria bacterium]|nr:conjugative transfer signal peptidase TraF [Alphaproteobacteria bacterium]